MTKIQIDKSRLEKLEALAPLLKKAKLHIEELNTKLHRKTKFANIKLSSAKFAAEAAEEVKNALEQQGVPEEVALKAAEVVADVVSGSQTEEEEATPEVPSEAMAQISPETSEQLAEVMEELPPDVKAQVAEMMTEEPSVDKMAKLMIPILKKVAKKSAFSSMGSVTSSNTEAKHSVEKTAALDKIYQLCK